MLAGISGCFLYSDVLSFERSQHDSYHLVKSHLTHRPCNAGA